MPGTIDKDQSIHLIINHNIISYDSGFGVCYPNWGIQEEKQV